MTVHIYAPDVVTKHAVAGTCPDCKRRTRFLTYTYEWHDPDATCIRCGRSFNGDGWAPLPFERGARAKEIDRAKRRFRATRAIGVEAMMARWDEERTANESGLCLKSAKQDAAE